MTEHRWDAATGYCQRCGVQKGSHAEECEAPENMISLQPYLRKRAGERGLIIGGNPNMQPSEGANPPPTAFPAPKGGIGSGIIVEAFPPPESA